MATLTLTVAANGDDMEISDLADQHPMRVGAVGTTPLAGHGHGYRFLNVTLTGADTINSAYLSLMKSGTQWSTQNDRWVAVDEDNTAGFTTTSPNRPGDRAIVSAQIADQSHNVNHVADTRYNFPTTGGLQTTLGASIAAVLDRAGWASGNALAIVDNSDQDASAYTGTSRKNWHDYDSATASSEPQLVIDYTAAAAARLPRAWAVATDRSRALAAKRWG